MLAAGQGDPNGANHMADAYRAAMRSIKQVPGMGGGEDDATALPSSPSRREKMGVSNA